MLSESESEGENEVQFTINEHFAKAYELKKEREELSKLQDKYGSDAELYDEDSEDSEDEETEDEDGEELTPAVDVAILRTLARIKKKDPEIYDAKRDVFEEEQQKTSSNRPGRSSTSKDKSKPLLMRQHILNSTLNPNSRSPSPVPALPTHVEAQAALRKETISAFHTAVSGPEDEQDEEDDLLIPREKTKNELEYEEEEYREFLAREVGEDISKLVTVAENPFSAEAVVDGAAGPSSVGVNDKQTKKKKGKGKDKSRKEETDQEFLMNYILNRGWIDRSDRHIPTYKEITSTRAPAVKTKKGVEIGNDDDDDAENDGEDKADQEGRNNIDADALNDFDEDDFDDIADTFESSYNFRFEEPGADTIATHPRNIEATVRRDENPRKAARERKKERKEEKMLKKREEVKRLKALKLKELKAKLERIGKEGGLENLDADVLEQLDLDADWDPDKHDEQMAEIYANAEGDADVDVDDTEKPAWDDDVDISDLLPGPSTSAAGPSSSKNDKKKKKKKGGAEEDGNGGVAVDVDTADADVNGDGDVEGEDEPEWDGTEDTRKKIVDAYVSQKLDALDFNDMIGDMPTRFHYMPVEPTSYGLTPAEILLADDADLNAYVGLKKIAPYRRNGKKHAKGKNGEPWDPKRQAKLRELREKLKEKQKKTGIGLDVQQPVANGEEKAKKRMGKKERLKRKQSSAVNEADETPSEMKKEHESSTLGKRTSSSKGGESGDEGEEAHSKKRKRKHNS